MLFSFLICLEAVPEETREWKPDTAPQAMVTKRKGNRVCPLTVKPEKAGRLTSGRAAKTPMTAATIMATSR